MLKVTHERAHLIERVDVVAFCNSSNGGEAAKDKNTYPSIIAVTCPLYILAAAFVHDQSRKWQLHGIS